MNLADLIAAMRLAIEAAADDAVLRSVIVELLEMAPESEGHRNEPVNLLIDAVQAADARFEVCS